LHHSKLESPGEKWPSIVVYQAENFEVTLGQRLRKSNLDMA